MKIFSGLVLVVLSLLASSLLEVRLRNLFPHPIRQITSNQFIHQVQRPDDYMEDEQQDGVIVKPADHGCVYAQQKINDSTASSVHIFQFEVLKIGAASSSNISECSQFRTSNFKPIGQNLNLQSQIFNLEFPTSIAGFAPLLESTFGSCDYLSSSAMRSPPKWLRVSNRSR